MILFINVFLSDDHKSPLGMSNNRGFLSTPSKIDVFLYTLHSYATIKWSKVVIYCELDNNQKQHEESLFNSIRLIFKDCELYNKRNCFQKDWKRALLPVVEDPNDTLIWFACNHDHPYLQPNHNQLKIWLKMIHADPSVYKGGCYSHFYETCVFFMQNDYNAWVDHNNGVSSYTTKRIDSMLVLNNNLLKSWWFDHDYGDNFMPRSDWHTVSAISPEFRCYMPVKELCRHFDGYDLRGDTFATNDIPPLSIPEGFFNDNIKIRFGFDQRAEGYTWINPLKPNYKAADPDGVDMKCILEDVPLFWRGRISSLEIDDTLDTDELLEKRNEALYFSAVPRVYRQKSQMEDPYKWLFIRDQRAHVPDSYLKWLYY